MTREDNAVWVTVQTKPDLLKYMIEKGSIAIDGVSLTIAYVDTAALRYPSFRIQVKKQFY